MPYQIQQTAAFAKWLSNLRDARAKSRILLRLRSALLGHLGDVRSAGSGVSEMRIDVGPGYRVYFTVRRQILIILLCGGDKSTQAKDIKRAQLFARRVD